MGRMNSQFVLMLISLVFITLISCGGKRESKEPDVSPTLDTVHQIAAVKIEQLKRRLEPSSGWVSPRDCDSLLWNGKLLAVEAFFDIVNIHVAEYEANGRYNRREYPPCYDSKNSPPNQGSASTTSNDMYTGLIIGLWMKRDLESLKRIAKYGEDNYWVMGDPFPGRADRVMMRPNFIGLLGRMLYALSDGKINKIYRHWPSLYSVSDKSYQRHLAALGIFIQGDVNSALGLNEQAKLDWDYALNKQIDYVQKTLGRKHPVAKEWESVKLTRSDSFSEISAGKFKVIKGLTEKEPNNPLFWVLRGLYEGNMDRAIALLADPNTEKPHYVRGEDVEGYWLVEWLFAYEILRKSVL